MLQTLGNLVVRVTETFFQLELVAAMRLFMLK